MFIVSLFDKDLEISLISTCFHCFIENEADLHVAKNIMSLSDKNIEIRYLKSIYNKTKHFVWSFQK